MDFKKQKPIYLQIADWLMEQILGGQPAEEDRMQSVRDVAASMGVNPNTVARSYEKLTDAGIIYNKRGIGYFVAVPARDIILAQQRREFLENEVPAFIRRMNLLGVKPSEIFNNE